MEISLTSTTKSHHPKPAAGMVESRTLDSSSSPPDSTYGEIVAALTHRFFLSWQFHPKSFFAMPQELTPSRFTSAPHSA
jgi:CTP synthase (UTP-ammonia lyase)